VKIDCGKIDSQTRLSIDLVPARESEAVSVLFANNSEQPLWFPIEEEPAYKLDQEAGLLYIWIGYFEEIYGRYVQQYMLPEMKQVKSGEQIRLSLTSPELAQTYLKHPIPLQIQARLSTIELKTSNVRGSQPLPEYLQNSCIIKSPVITLLGQADQ